MKVYCNYNPRKYQSKPSPESTKIIQNELLKPCKVEVAELVENVGKGANFRAAAINGRADSEFISQQLFALDIDNKTDIITPQQALERSESAGLKPMFMYETYSSTADIPRFRMVFCADRMITDEAERKAIQLYLIGLFSEADKSCANASRIFFGTDKGILQSDYKALFDVEMVLAKSCKHKRRKAPNKPKTSLQADNENIEAIKRHDIQFLKTKLNKPARQFDNKDDFFKFLYRGIDLAELLGVRASKSFKCIFHEDTNPSANVYKEKHGVWKYKCFGSECRTQGRALNTKQVVELLGGFDSEYQAMNFLKAIYNVSINESEWSKEQQTNIDEILNKLSMSGESGFEKICPVAAHNTRNCRYLFMQALCIAKNTIFPDRTTQGDVIFYMSIRQLSKAAGKSSIDKVSKYLKMLEYHKMLNLVPDSEVPRIFLKKALESKQNGHNHIQFYSIPSWVLSHTQRIEEQGQKWKNNNYRVSAISYELFLRTEGQEVAGQLYPQTSFYTQNGKVMQKQTIKAADKTQEILAAILIEQITQKGYTTEKEILLAAPANLSKAEIQLKRSIAEIMQCNNLIKCRANKVIKAEYGIISNGYPVIIIQEKGERNIH